MICRLSAILLFLQCQELSAEIFTVSNITLISSLPASSAADDDGLRPALHKPVQKSMQDDQKKTIALENLKSDIFHSMAGSNLDELSDCECVIINLSLQQRHFDVV